MVANEGFYVPRDADAATLENARQTVERELNRLTVRAYDLVDRTGSAAP
jgi:hypothetical protein